MGLIHRPTLSQETFMEKLHKVVLHIICNYLHINPQGIHSHMQTRMHMQVHRRTHTHTHRLECTRLSKVLCSPLEKPLGSSGTQLIPGIPQARYPRTEVRWEGAEFG